MNDFIDDDGFEDQDFFEDNSDSDMETDDDLNEEMRGGSDNNDTFDIGWQEIAMFGALSEQIAEEERERLKILKEMNKDKNQEKKQ